MGAFLLFLPETAVLLTALAVFVAIIVRSSATTCRGIALVGASVALLSCASLSHLSGQPFAPGIYSVDLFSQVIKTLLLAALLLCLVLGERPHTIRVDARSEFSLFLLIATVGMMMMASATELLTLYLSLELSAFPVYALAALHRGGSRGSEGAAKYMLQGMIASAVTLYGISFLFGLTGSTYIADVATKLPELTPQPLFWTALLLALGGFAFKLGLFPFHFWAPDTYETAPHPVVAFLATASKGAAVAVLCRFAALVAMGDGAAGLDGLQFVLAVFSVAAMTFGNLAAFAQKDFKRLLGWSAVAHAGYIGVGFQAFSELGVTAIVFYAFGYLAMTWLCLMVANEVCRDRDDAPIEALSGLWRRSPFLGLCLLIGVFGLTGLPPTAGFIGKWFLFSAALEQEQFVLVLIAALNSAVAVYYYLRVIKVAYLSDDGGATVRPRPLVVAGAVTACIAVLWIGAWPGALWQVIEASTVTLMTGM